MHHKRRRVKKRRAGGRKHGRCKPHKVNGNRNAAAMQTLQEQRARLGEREQLGGH